jgi:hypothetical protein
MVSTIFIKASSYTIYQNTPQSSPTPPPAQPSAPTPAIVSPTQYPVSSASVIHRQLLKNDLRPASYHPQNYLRKLKYGMFLRIPEKLWESFNKRRGMRHTPIPHKVRCRFINRQRLIRHHQSINSLYHHAHSKNFLSANHPRTRSGPRRAAPAR